MEPVISLVIIKVIVIFLVVDHPKQVIKNFVLLAISVPE